MRKDSKNYIRIAKIPLKMKIPYKFDLFLPDFVISDYFFSRT